jgi:signal transduction histidine kinase
MDVLRRLTRQVGTGAELALGAAMAAAIALSALITAWADKGWPFGLAVGIVICAPALVRHRNRAPAAVAGLVLFAAASLAVVLGAAAPGPLYGGGLVGLLVLGAAAVRALPPVPAALIGVAGTAVIAAGETAGPGGLLDHRTGWALAGVTAWSAALAIGLYLRYVDFLHRQTLESARHAERQALARELHDVVAHHVTGIVVQAQAAQFAAGPDPAALTAALARIETAGTDTLTAIRQLVGLLRDPDDTVGTSPGPEPLSQLVERFARHGPAVDLHLPAPPGSAWPPEVDSTVYRIVAEALTNIARHAPQARSVTVTVSRDPREVRVEITDDAPPPAVRHSRPGSGYGLVGMRERVEALGGQLRAGPRPGAGWTVQASLPVPVPGRP